MRASVTVVCIILLGAPALAAEVSFGFAVLGSATECTGFEERREREFQRDDEVEHRGTSDWDVACDDQLPIAGASVRDEESDSTLVAAEAGSVSHREERGAYDFGWTESRATCADDLPCRSQSHLEGSSSAEGTSSFGARGEVAGTQLAATEDCAEERTLREEHAQTLEWNESAAAWDSGWSSHWTTTGSRTCAVRATAADEEVVLRECASEGDQDLWWNTTRRGPPSETREGTASSSSTCDVGPQGDVAVAGTGTPADGAAARSGTVVREETAASCVDDVCTSTTRRAVIVDVEAHGAGLPVEVATEIPA